METPLLLLVFRNFLQAGDLGCVDYSQLADGHGLNKVCLAAPDIVSLV